MAIDYDSSRIGPTVNSLNIAPKVRAVFSVILRFMPKLTPLAAILFLVGALSLSPRAKAAPAPAIPAPAPAVSTAPNAPDLPAASPDDASEMARLKELPANHIPLRGATLASAIRLLAESAHMSYIAPPDADFGERISSDVMMNPYDLLQMLAENYHFGMEYRNGVWWFYSINLNEMVTKAYTLRYNNLQQVQINGSSINGQLAAFNASGGGMAGGMGGGSSGGMGGPSGGSGAGMGRSSGGGGGGGGGTFNSKTDKIIEDIKKIIGLPTVGLMTPTLEGSSDVPGMGADRKAVEAPKIDPIWNPDTSQLFVVATRQQHSLISAYLKTIDQPQKLIRISVKFVETARNPTQALGVDWSQTFLGSGGPLTLSGGALSTTATAISNAGAATITTSNQSGSSAGTTTQHRKHDGKQFEQLHHRNAQSAVHRHQSESPRQYFAADFTSLGAGLPIHRAGHRHGSIQFGRAGSGDLHFE